MARRGLKPGQTTSTSWKPGQSGNPKGYPKQTTDWRSQLRADDKLHDLAIRAARGELSAEERKHLNTEMIRFHLENAHGRAPQTVKLENMISIDEVVEDVREWLESKGLREEFEAWLKARAK